MGGHSKWVHICAQREEEEKEAPKASKGFADLTFKCRFCSQVNSAVSSIIRIHRLV
uniref:Uncharacterized protein n=1 Tax=Echinococcus granulosus TaxID=6210 RepID=A0A068WU09_ECHGR|nr:hypothetical protein EgrG_000153300 [Echinococcus granulosus]